MTIGSIIMLVVGIISAIVGAIAGRSIGKSQGKKEGVEEQKQTQTIEQAQATVKSVKERSNAEATVSADSDDELDLRLSKHSRPD